MFYINIVNNELILLWKILFHLILFSNNNLDNLLRISALIYFIFFINSEREEEYGKQLTLTVG